jgi:excisionase family DNA binding protein
MFGGAWKFVSVLTGAFGVWRSPGHLRRWFGIAFLISLLIWGAHDLKDLTWDGHPVWIFWWVMSFGTRYHADGVQADLAARLLTVKEAAAYLGRSESALYHLKARGEIPYIGHRRHLRFDVEQLNSWIKGDRV